MTRGHADLPVRARLDRLRAPGKGLLAGIVVTALLASSSATAALPATVGSRGSERTTSDWPKSFERLGDPLTGPFARHRLGTAR
jgi:hypothetical protein